MKWEGGKPDWAIDGVHVPPPDGDRRDLEARRDRVATDLHAFVEECIRVRDEGRAALKTAAELEDVQRREERIAAAEAEARAANTGLRAAAVLLRGMVADLPARHVVAVEDFLARYGL